MLLETSVSFQGEIKMAEKAFETEELEETFMIICRGEVLLFNKLCPCSPYKLYVPPYVFQAGLQGITTNGIATKGIDYKRYQQQMVSATEGIDRTA